MPIAIAALPANNIMLLLYQANPLRIKDNSVDIKPKTNETPPAVVNLEFDSHCISNIHAKNKNEIEPIRLKCKYARIIGLLKNAKDSNNGRTDEHCNIIFKVNDARNTVMNNRSSLPFA